MLFSFVILNLFYSFIYWFDLLFTFLLFSISNDIIKSAENLDLK